MFYCYQYITVVHFVAKVGTLIGENRYVFTGENWYTLFYCLHLTLNYVGTNGRIAYGSGVKKVGNKDLVRINYETFIK